jgi:hypothetical protein
MGMNISEVGGDIFDYQYKIDEIKEVIKNYKDFGTGDVMAESSPSVDAPGNLTHLIEHFNENSVDVEVYGDWDNSVDNYSLSYEELSEEVIDEILNLAQEWQTICEEEADQL